MFVVKGRGFVSKRFYPFKVPLGFQGSLPPLHHHFNIK